MFDGALAEPMMKETVMVYVDTPRLGRIPQHNHRTAPLSPAARTAIVLIGTAGLVALAVAIVGPARIQRQVLEPLRDAVEPRAEKAWADMRPLRDQIAALLEKASPEGRRAMVRSFQSWIGHFRAD